MCKKAIFILLLFNGYVLSTSSVADSWSDFAETMKDSMKKCPVNLNMFDCIRDCSLDVFDNMIASDVIPLTVEMKLIRKHALQQTPIADIEQPLDKTIDRSNTALSKASWSGYILKKLINLLSTHTLNIDLTQTAAVGRGPNRRNRNQMIPMMILGVTALGAFTIPMGFQFLSIVSGKALLLAKMALIMAIMNGAKRVASSGVHYGLYHSEPHHQHGYHYLDRGDTNQPRFSRM
ncbi:uncharacterized protein LOC119075249 [Bradysia coprophila]|uniref:uncharacterized protein LOC119075249 n=1 Tax=Bradysia coprophila TaxID=38358 RepID=UPI00187DBF77|nr:uncharacterized protein LOC119075249 [Bradysia coprophila]